jgi:hypothetical protein
MKRQAICTLTISLLLAAGTALRAESTIDPAHPYAYGANFGWVNARADSTNGAVIGEFYCSGWLYGANVGWICLGGGAPTNGYAYGNATATDYGVNHNGAGRLSGYAWAPNLGWVAFEQTYGQPKADLLTGNLSGYVWSGNAGWISLSNSQAYVRTMTLVSGPDTDADGLPDAWEYAHTNSLSVLSGLGGADADHDGMSDAQEYVGDTDPLDNTSLLRITALAREGTTNWVTWTCRPTRLYTLERMGTLLTNDWAAASGTLLPPEGATTLTAPDTASTATTRFYHATVDVPFSP